VSGSAGDLAALATMSPAQLRSEWHARYRTVAPPIGPDLMRRAIAWKLQSQVHGGLPTSTRKTIEAALSQLEKGSRVDTTKLRLKPGTRLVRRWQDKAYHVLVLEEGFEHEGRRYASLSQIARAITGAHWSGPRFFGLRQNKSGSDRG
jgi:hypothetical protein